MLKKSTINPKGPDFRKARKIHKELSGSIVTFSAPPARDPFSSSESWEQEPSKLDIFSSESFSPYWVLRKNGDKQILDGISSIKIYSNIWEFRGLPIIEGYCGDLILNIEVLSIDSLPINESLFDNKILSKHAYKLFEITKLQDFHSGYSNDPKDITEYRWPSYIGPINSQWLENSGLDWLYMEDQPLIGKTHELLWLTPLDHKLLLSFSFSYTRSSKRADNPLSIEQKVANNSFLELASKIFESVEVQLSESSKSAKSSTHHNQSNNKKLVLDVTPKQLKEAEKILHMWNSGKNQGNNVEMNTNSEEIAQFLKERIKHRPLKNSYPVEEALHLSGQK